ncbi:MAG: lipopolysaccharide biosynthesis protein [Saprospiraceae bacterium]|nr:lipopolysaccharide biosynthesis protein [Saprospiraceae bacterium]
MLLYLSAHQISLFFNEPTLEEIIGVLSLSIIINAIAIVPGVYLEKKLDFKSLAKISFTSSGISGAIAIYLAYQGFGVWSLVWRAIIGGVIKSALMFIVANPQIKIKFSRQSFKELFSFGSKLFLSSLINEIYLNIFYFVIGKYFSVRELGLYTRADGYKDLPSKTLNHVIHSVSYPVLSEIKDNDARLKKGYEKLIKLTMYLSFALMLGLAGAAHSFIVGLIGTKWVEAIPYLQLLCLVGIFYPLDTINLTMLKVKGRSDIFLSFEIIKKLLSIPVIFIGIFFNIKAMIIALIIASATGYLMSAYLSGNLIGYKLRDQLIDILPYLSLGLLLGSVLFLLDNFIAIHPLMMLFCQSFIGLGIVILFSHLFKLQPYFEIKDYVLNRFAKVKKTNFNFHNTP